MLFKLSLRNARRQTRDYLVYFITITLTAVLIYAFNGLIGSQEMKTLSGMMDTLPITITAASIVVVGIMGWLVHYTMRFMLEKRSRELGTYILMGLENDQVARMFLWENLVIGGIALGLGLIFGNLLFQALRAIILNLFSLPYRFSFTFSGLAVGLTFLYFLLIYVYALFRCKRRIQKLNIHKLLYLERQNETEAVKKKHVRRRMFTSSIICGIIGTMLLVTRQLALGMLGAALLIFALYAFFINFASGVPSFFDKRPAAKYRKTNLLIFRSLTAKMTTMGATMATIAVLITATLIAEGSGIIFFNLFERRLDMYTKFDLFVSSGVEDYDLDEYKDYIRANVDLRSSHEYDIYYNDTHEVVDYLRASGKDYWSEQSQDAVMKFSDYSALREILGYPAVSLGADQYLIHCLDYWQPEIEAFQKPLESGEFSLSKQGVYTENLTQYYWSGNGDGFILVVPDDFITDQKTAFHIFAGMTEGPLNIFDYQELVKIRDQRYEQDMPYEAVISMGGMRSENAAMMAVIIFPLFYLALILTMAATTILTVQLLSDSGRHKRQLDLLHKLGQSRRDMGKALNQQFVLFYAMPVLPALLISVSFLVSLVSVMDTGIITGPLHFISIIGVILLLFLGIYLLYIAAAYSSFKKSVMPE